MGVVRHTRTTLFFLRKTSVSAAKTGGGVFTGGFMSIHSGEISIDDVGKQRSSYSAAFEVTVTF
jgi:hypothetical protein